MVFLILTFMMAFMCLGFWTLSSPSEFVTGVTTAAVFVVGGGVNIPLQQDSRDRELEQKLFMKRVKEEAVVDAKEREKRKSHQHAEDLAL